jgi:hypothetical protein
MNPRVSSVEYKGAYQLLLTFTNKEVKQFYFSSYLHYPVYEPLKDESFYQKVKATNGIVQWDEFIDFDPDAVYLESKSAH